MPGSNWIAFAKKESEKSKSYKKFYNSMRSRKSTIINYSYCFNRFMIFLLEKKEIDKKDDYDKLIEFDSDKITDLIQDYTFELNDQMRGNTVQSYLNAPKIFFGMNNKTYNNLIIRKSVKREDLISGGSVAATDEDIQSLLSVTVRPLEIALIHFLTSTGIRPGALMDPVLRMKHLSEMPNGCKSIKVYDESKEGYWAFLTPESVLALQKYFNFRKQKGEVLDEESPLFCPKNKSKNASLTCSTARDIISKLIKRAGIIRVKKGNRFDKATMYMFRKRFNTKLKMENSVNSNIAEKLMAHKRGLDGTYLAPTKEECFNEFKKAILVLTVDPTQRQKVELQKNQDKIDELAAKNQENNELKKRMDKLEQMLEVRKKFVQNT